MKDWAFAKTLCGIWYFWLSKKYGYMINLKIDSTNKTLAIELMLKGETVPVKLEADYKLVDEAGGLFLEIHNPECGSREWLTALLNESLVQEKMRFKLPLQKVLKFCL
jgi:hypothetical protein